MSRVYRIDPVGDPNSYKTYRVEAPLATHFRKATCAEQECPNYLNGWATYADEATERGMAAGFYIRNQAGRRFIEERDERGVTVFYFYPGQTCFESHHTRLDRPELFLIKGGDWRTPGRGREIPAQSWMDDFGEHQEHIKEEMERG